MGGGNGLLGSGAIGSSRQGRPCKREEKKSRLVELERTLQVGNELVD